MSAVPGEIQEKFRRTYICVQPDAALGPPTWRLAVTEEIGTGSGTPVQAAYNFSGDLPIKMEDTLNENVPTERDVTTSMAIDELPDIKDRVEATPDPETED